MEYGGVWPNGFLYGRFRLPYLLPRLINVSKLLRWSDRSNLHAGSAVLEWAHTKVRHSKYHSSLLINVFPAAISTHVGETV